MSPHIQHISSTCGLNYSQTVFTFNFSTISDSSRASRRRGLHISQFVSELESAAARVQCLLEQEHLEGPARSSSCGPGSSGPERPSEAAARWISSPPQDRTWRSEPRRLLNQPPPRLGADVTPVSGQRCHNSVPLRLHNSG